MLVCVCGTGWPFHFKQPGWWEKEGLLLSNSRLEAGSLVCVTYGTEVAGCKTLETNPQTKADKYNQKPPPVLAQLFFIVSISEMLML